VNGNEETRVFLVVQESSLEGEETLGVYTSREAAEECAWDADRDQRHDYEYTRANRVYVCEWVGEGPALKWASEVTVPRSYSPETMEQATKYRQNPERVREAMAKETAKAAAWARRYDLRVAG